MRKFAFKIGKIESRDNAQSPENVKIIGKNSQKFNKSVFIISISHNSTRSQTEDNIVPKSEIEQPEKVFIH